MRSFAIAILSGVLLAPGCVRLAGPDNVSLELSRAAGVDLQQEIGLTVTRSGIWLAKKSLKWADETEFSLDGLRRVEVGVYTVRGTRPGGREPLGEHLFPSAWSPWVRVQDDDAEVFVMVRQGDEPEDIRGMIVVVAESEEWVVVRLHGDLYRVLEDTMRFAFDQAERPDLYDKTREQRELPPLGEV